jgi:hypothetical protein
MYVPITVVAPPKAWTVLAPSNTGVMGSNLNRDKDVIYSVFVISCVEVAALRRADPLSKESYRLYRGLQNCKVDIIQQRALEPLMNEWKVRTNKL